MRLWKLGIVHRDIKPINIVINKNLTDIKLLNFDVAYFHNSYD